MKTATRPNSMQQQRGVVLVFALIALVIMLIGAVAITRSINSSQFNIGNIGFKRDLANQSERAVQLAMNAVNAGGALADPTKRLTALASANYSAVKLADNIQGIPNILLQSDAQFATVGTAPDIDVSGMNVKVRYVVDRLATAEGACNSTNCTMSTAQVFGGAASELNPVTPTPQPVYRLTVRLTGPRNTLSFFQSTFTAP